MSINSTYYLGDYILSVIKPLDTLITMAHKVNTRTPLGELLNVYKTNANVEFGNWSLTMDVSGTTDKYAHGSRTIMDFNVIGNGIVTLTKVDVSE